MSKSFKVITVISLYILGIICFFYPLGFIFASLILCGAIYLFFKKKIISLNNLLLIITFFILGFVNSNYHLIYYDDLTTYTNQNDIVLEAEVVSIPTNNLEGKTKFYANVSSILADKTKTNDIKAKTLVSITDEKEKINKLKIGDTVKLKGRLKSPDIATNPHQFDYAKYLQFKNTFSLMYVTNEWEIISQTNTIKGKLIRKLNDTRNNILEKHRKNIPSPMIEVLGGIIFGDDAVNPDEDTKEAFMKSGIFHILAASGMNVTLIFGIWFFFARHLRFNYNFSIIAGILLILTYTCMTGFGPPIIRAFLMLTFILLGKLIERKTSTISLLFLVGFLMLLYNPLMLFDVGFQLSFIVTFGLILCAPLLVFDFKFKPINYILGIILVPVIAQIFAAPLQLFYFNTFSLYSILSNIAIIPVLSIVSFVGFISSILALIPTIAEKVCLFADTLLTPLLIYIVKSANFFSQLPNAILYFKTPTTIQLLLYYAIIITLFSFFILKIKNKKYWIGLATLFILFLFSFIPSFNKTSEIIFFSVGNADAILLKSPRNDYYLIDTGKLPYLSSTSQANKIINNYFRKQGIKELSTLIITHFDSDHAGGTIDVLKHLKVKRIFLSNAEEDTLLSKTIKDYIYENRTKFNFTPQGHGEISDEDFKILIYNPERDNLKDENEKSLVILLETNGKKVLFMGDGNINTFDILPNEYKTNIDILKIGHHGAKDTINNEMIENSNINIISTGVNIYNHPDSLTIKMLENNNKIYYRTDKNNALKFTLEKGKLQGFSYSPKDKKFIELK